MQSTNPQFPHHISMQKFIYIIYLFKIFIYLLLYKFLNKLRWVFHVNVSIGFA